MQNICELMSVCYPVLEHRINILNIVKNVILQSFFATLAEKIFDNALIIEIRFTFYTYILNFQHFYSIAKQYIIREQTAINM